MKKIIAATIMFMFSISLNGCKGSTPATSSPTPAATQTVSPTPAPTETPASTPAPTSAISPTPSASSTPAATAGNLKLGDTGERVKELQISLNKFRYNLAVDGIFGKGTEYAVKDFQSKVNLTADGIAGPATLAKLTSTPAADPYLYYSVSDYYPFKANVKYTYEGSGNEYASYTVFVDYLAGGREQIRINNGGTEAVKVLQNKDGEIKVQYSAGEIYYRENLTSKANDKQDILLKEPLQKGTSWSGYGGTKSITGTKVDINTPLGSYKCVEVTTTGNEYTNKDYYALNVGLVKSVFTAGNGSGDITSQVSSTLSKLEANVPLIQNVKFYYPNVPDDVINFMERKLSFNTNDITRDAFKRYFRTAPTSKTGRLISANTQINYLYLGSDNIVYVDFSKEFVTEMNAGSGYEGMILQCITNTLGDYYNANKVYLTVGGQPYSSGHILMKKGETFTVHPSGEKQAVEILSSANQYTVKAGDTLYKIANMYGVTVQDLVTANNLANADSIYPNQVLIIP